MIEFYRAGDEYGCFSNFSDHGFFLKDRYWSSSEHYFQAQKFVGTEHEETVRLAATPKEAAQLGRSRDLPLRPDWASIKEEIMKEAVLAKFRTHLDIRQILLSTGTQEIVEASPIDYYWGCGADRTGKNALGLVLMEVRSILADENEPKST
ncbi:MAG: NADAR family protein [Oscillospiraceae bacterium]|nr:NADAR family protein [Oscillospiraceae bacterium]